MYRRSSEVACNLFVIISDRGTLLTSYLLKPFQIRHGTSAKHNTFFHPQTECQAKQTILTLDDMLRAYAIDFKGN